MSRPVQLPVSELIKYGKKAGEEDQATKKRVNDFREQKELEEQRKAGTAPAMVDVETGRDINPHIPEFIEKTPWYVATDGPTLKHQRPHEERQKEFANITEWYNKGTTNNIAYKFRKGACENCGAMGHKKRDCFERPRKVGAKFTEEDMAPDDFVQPNLSLNYDAKRDRWNGFESSTYAETVVKEHEEMAEIAKVLKAEKIKKGEIQADAEAGEEETAAAEEVPEDDDKYADEMSLGQSVDMDSRTRITVRNLRIREDTAKYLYNLNESGPYYDPKSRSMRENPFLGVPGKEAEAAKFSGENYVRYTGEVVKANEAQLFAWQARAKGVDVHATAEPTKLEFLQRKFDEQRETLKDTNMKKLLESYGGEEHLDAPAKELLLAQTENYVEYNRRGNIIKGEQRPLLKSKYEEDILIGNHTSIWGSYWKAGQWGYRCCHAFIKNSYCVGAKGYANDTETFTRMPSTATQIKPKPAEAFKVPEKPEMTEIIEKEERKKNNKKEESGSESSSESEESEAEQVTAVDEDKKMAMEEELQDEKEKRAKKEHQRKIKRDKRKRQKERKREKTEKEGKKKRKRRRSSPSSSSSSSSDSEAEPNLKKAKGDPALREAIKKAAKEREAGKAMKQIDDRDRSYHSLAQYETKAPTAVEVEAYNLTRIHSSDPMASHFSK